MRIREEVRIKTHKLKNILWHVTPYCPIEVHRL
jgi:hypothetical protein